MVLEVISVRYIVSELGASMLASVAKEEQVNRLALSCYVELSEMS